MIVEYHNLKMKTDPSKLGPKSLDQTQVAHAYWKSKKDYEGMMAFAKSKSQSLKSDKNVASETIATAYYNALLKDISKFFLDNSYLSDASKVNSYLINAT